MFAPLVQLIVVVAVPGDAVIFLTASQSLMPSVPGFAGAVTLQPSAVVYELLVAVAHVYVELPVGVAG